MLPGFFFLCDVREVQARQTGGWNSLLWVGAIILRLTLLNIFPSSLHHRIATSVIFTDRATPYSYACFLPDHLFTSFTCCSQSQANPNIHRPYQNQNQSQKELGKNCCWSHRPKNNASYHTHTHNRRLFVCAVCLFFFVFLFLVTYSHKYQMKEEGADNHPQFTLTSRQTRCYLFIDFSLLFLVDDRYVFCFVSTFCVCIIRPTFRHRTANNLII